jgi:hypothetical protein
MVGIVVGTAVGVVGGTIVGTVVGAAGDDVEALPVPHATASRGRSSRRHARRLGRIRVTSTDGVCRQCPEADLTKL